MAKTKKPPTSSVRFNEAQEEAIQAALRIRRARTRENATRSDAIREGVAGYVQSEGIEWPADDDKGKARLAQ